MTVEMQTLGDYMPLAGTGCNTMRRARPEYARLGPGSRVHMEYRPTDGDATLFASEQLEVSSVALGSLDQLCRWHAGLNHGVIAHRRTADGGQQLANPNAAAEWLKARMLELYGEDAEGDLFMVVYFR
jgi:hypothetical protein